MPKNLWPKRHVESEATAPWGGRMRWTVDVEHGAGCCVYITEDVVNEHGEMPANGIDRLLLDLEATEWLHARLGEAIGEIKKHLAAEAAEVPNG